jgi:hypothetical protein
LGYEEDIPPPVFSWETEGEGEERGREKREREREAPMKGCGEETSEGRMRWSFFDWRESGAGRFGGWVGLAMCCVVVLCYHGFSFFLWYLLTLIPLRMDEYEAGMDGWMDVGMSERAGRAG